MAELSTYNQYVRERTIYNPAMMNFDGSTGYYSKTGLAITGNKFTVVCRFKITEFTDANAYEAIFSVVDGNNYYRPLVIVYDNTNADVDRRNKLAMLVRSNSGVYIGELFSTINVADNQWHNLLVAFDGDNGTAVMLIDGVDVLDTSHADHTLTTGTLTTGSSAGVATLSSAILRHWSGEIGFFGYDDQYLTIWSNFFNSNGEPVKQDESVWANSGWGSQPLFWNEHGFMEDDKGSLGNMTKNGTIVIAPAEEFSNG